jgi:hypothetical protein
MGSNKWWEKYEKQGPSVCVCVYVCVCERRVTNGGENTRNMYVASLVFSLV